MGDKSELPMCFEIAELIKSGKKVKKINIRLKDIHLNTWLGNAIEQVMPDANKLSELERYVESFEITPGLELRIYPIKTGVSYRVFFVHDEKYSTQVNDMAEKASRILCRKPIHKIGGIEIVNKKLLLCMKNGVYIIPGGRLEKGEGHIACLKRELMEELRVELDTYKYFRVFEGDASLDPGEKLLMETYLITFTGKPTPSREIEKIAYVNSKNEDNLLLGAVAEHQVIPELLRTGIID